MHRTLIVARMDPKDSESVATVFEESDSTDLPHVIGVARRTLFSFHDLYFHLVEADQDISPHLYRARSHPLYLADTEGLIGQGRKNNDVMRCIKIFEFLTAEPACKPDLIPQSKISYHFDQSVSELGVHRPPGD